MAIRDCNSCSAEMTVGEWREQYSITKCDYYYWMKVVRQVCLDQVKTAAIIQDIVSCTDILNYYR